MKRTSKFWMLLLSIFILFLLLSCFSVGLIQKQYRKESADEISRLYAAVHEAYPDVDSEELLAIFRGEGPAPDTEFLEQYGYQLTESASAASSRATRRLLVSQALVFLGLLFCEALAIFLYERRRRRQIQALADDLNAVGAGHYDLQIADNSEDDLSRLRNDLYRITVRLKESAEASQHQTEALSRSLEDISHQLKTPLTSMRIMLDNIEDNPDMPEELRNEFLSSVSQQTERISELVIRLLHLAQFDSGVIRMNPQPIAIGDLLTEVKEKLSILAEVKGIQIEVTGPADAVLSLDRHWESEAIGNIVKNALEHSPEGSTVHLIVEDSALFLKLMIRDEGEGMIPEDQRHIFERFYKAKNSTKDSVGIGLSFAKTVIEEENGTVTVDSVLGEGTTFTIRWKK